MSSILILILVLPLVGGFIGYWVPSKSSAIGIAATFCSLFAALNSLSNFKSDISFTWYWLPDFELSILADNVSLMLISLVTFVSMLVQIFSSEYMKDDKGIHRFYFKLGFFISSMIGLLLADNLLLLFVFWELVGLASYLLIGFWYKNDDIPKSARTAFMVNRVADAALLAGIIMVYNQTGNLSISSISENITLLGSLLIAIGAFGKSAQFPFSGWLTKAMVGPTPVSALIHAATMVAAGVYLLFRVAPVLHPSALIIIAIIGTLTALYAAICAITQFDIKKVLAYSTISQLGYMTLGVGVGAREAALFHLFTHAFFKAGLFLGAASIIHYLHKTSSKDAQDMRFMGGLKNHLPWTYRSFLICGLALAGLPLFSGFMSKDGILLAAWAFASEHETWAYLIPDIVLITALMTAFYVGRMILLVFWGEERSEIGIARIETKAIVIPLFTLGLLSIWIFHNWNPFAHEALIFSTLNISNSHGDGGFLIPFVSIFLVSVGLALAYSFFKPGTNYSVGFSAMKLPSSKVGSLVFNGFGLTWLYEKVGEMSLAISKALTWIDLNVIDRFLHLFAIGSVIFSKVLSLIDRFVIDGPVNWIARLSAFIGRRLSGFSARDGQTQIAWLLVVVILILIFRLAFIN